MSEAVSSPCRQREEMGPCVPSEEVSGLPLPIAAYGFLVFGCLEDGVHLLSTGETPPESSSGSPATRETWTSRKEPDQADHRTGALL